MSWQFSTTTEQVARKDYSCDAWGWLDNDDWREFTSLTFSERKAIVRAKRNGFKIKAGERYIKTAGKWGGEFCTFRAIPALNDICKKYDVYED